MTIMLGGTNGVITDPKKFSINQDTKAVLTPNQQYTFEGNVAGGGNYNKPPRKSKGKLVWDI